MILSFFFFHSFTYKCLLQMKEMSLAGRRAWSLVFLRLGQLDQISLITKSLILIVFAALRPPVLQKNIIFCLFVLDVLLLENLTKGFKSNEIVRFSIASRILQHILPCSKFSGNSFHGCSWFISSTFHFLGFVRCIAKSIKI